MPRLPTKRKNNSLQAETVKRLNETRELMEQVGYNPIEAMIEMARDANVDSRVRASLHKDLAQYYTPKYRPAGEDGAGGGASGISVKVNKFTVNINQGNGPPPPPDNVIEGEVVDGD